MGLSPVFVLLLVYCSHAAMGARMLMCYQIKVNAKTNARTKRLLADDILFILASFWQVSGFHAVHPV